MTINKPRTSFGIHSMTAISRTTGLPYGIVKVLGNLEFTSEREAIDLFGGSNPNTWDSEMGSITPDLTLTVREYKPFLYTLAGFTSSSGAAEASGGVDAITNTYGTSVVDAATGIASVAISTGAGAPTDIKSGVYIAIAASATTVDLYNVTDIDFTEGTDKTYVNDALKITTAAVTITQSADTDISGYGFKLTGGSGTIGMTIGDTATSEVRRVNEGVETFTYGNNPVPIEFGAYLFSQKKANGEYHRFYVPRAKLASVPEIMTEKDWAELTLNMKVLYDSTLGYSVKKQDIIKDEA